MVIQVEEIREAGLTVKEPVSAALLNEALSAGHDTGFRARVPAELTVALRRVSHGVLLHGELNPTLTALCKRCLDEIEIVVPVSFDLNLVPESVIKKQLEREGDPKKKRDGRENDDDLGAPEDGSFDLENADQEAFDGKKIDLDPIVCEQVMLALPMDAVCREDCKGLCGRCGQNLNDKQCGCEESRVDLRLTALKDIKLN